MIVTRWQATCAELGHNRCEIPGKGLVCGRCGDVQTPPADDFRTQGCRFPEKPHTCQYLCEHGDCTAAVADADVHGDKVFCPAHRHVRAL